MSTPELPLNSMNSPDDHEEFRQMTKKAFWLSAITIFLLFVGLGIVGIYFENEVEGVSQWFYINFGFKGFLLFQYIADLLLSPIPPDILLVFIAKSEMRTNWFEYVSALGIASTLAGFSGWWLGKNIVNRPWTPTYLKTFSQKHTKAIHKFGPLIVVLGATTPLPFSVTCWGAGVLNMKLLPFALAVSVRYLRVIAYYQVIHHSDVFSWLYSSWLELTKGL